MTKIYLTELELTSITTSFKEIDNTMFGVISRVFNFDSSLKSDVIKGLQISRTERTKENRYTFTLTVNPGYLINGKNSLSSNQFTVITHLNITQRPILGQNDIDLTIAAWNNTYSPDIFGPGVQGGCENLSFG